MNENEMNTCKNYYPIKCENLATVIHYDCCDLDRLMCDDCVQYCGETKSCDWYVMTLDRLIIASSDPSDIGERY